MSAMTKLAQDAVGLTRELIRIPSLNPPGDEEQCARFTAELLEANGFAVQLHSFGPRRFNLVADLPGQSGGLPLGFTGHFDTVPLGNAPWTFDPHAAQEADGKLYGRGSSDMKAGIAAFIAACVQSREALQRKGGVHIVITGGEETGCDGAKALTANARTMLRPVSLLLVGEPTCNYPYIGHKGALWLAGVASGKTAHGSMPEQGDNAIYKLVRAINKLQGLQMPQQHALMGKPSFNVGTVQGGLNVNSVPDRAKFELDIRTVPGMEHGCLCDHIAEFLGDEIAISTIVDVPSLSTSAEDASVRRIFDICAPYHAEGIVPRSVPYFTDGSVLVPAVGNPPTVILGPGELKMAHKTDEYCVIERVRQAQEIYRTILLDQDLAG